jgi:putative ATPase
VAEAVQRRQVRYDRAGDDHYQTVSAFIKSLRGSDPDAAVFYLAKMLAAGEDPRFIARRMVILASEDVGNADPQGLVVATAAAEAVERIGLPEAGLNLAQAATYLATAPKSNRAAQALWRAQAAIEAGANTEVPLHLRNASFGGARALGYGQGYQYAHDYAGAHVAQRYLPAGVDERFYEPGEQGYEREIAARLRRWRAAGGAPGAPGAAAPAAAGPAGPAGDGQSSGATSPHQNDPADAPSR